MSELLTQYLEAQLAGDRDQALRVVTAKGLFVGVAAEDLYLDVIGPAQRELGRLWETNRISVAAEHQASAISEFVLAQLYPHLLRAPRNGWSTVVACVAGEMHGMAARMISDFLEAAGFDVRFLGADVPTNSLVGQLVERRPDLVALSSTMPFNLSVLNRTIIRLRRICGHTLPIIAGGFLEGAAPQLSPELLVHVSSGTARDLVALVRRLLGAPP
jgi:methanogenic corrinoid protein MtbC1